MTDALLAFFHISAVLAWVVFATSEAALCRSEWLNAAAVARLVRIDRILWVATAAVLLTGLLRVFWGAKPAVWYAGNWLLYLKAALFVAVAFGMVMPTRRYAQWLAALAAGGGLPGESEVRAVRRRVMLGTHVVALLPLAAVFVARGWGG